ncbi:MAG: hypothetical protein PVSMB7_30250 [Chloroflexota bacterium]
MALSLLTLFVRHAAVPVLSGGRVVGQMDAAPEEPQAIIRASSGSSGRFM